MKTKRRIRKPSTWDRKLQRWSHRGPWYHRGHCFEKVLDKDYKKIIDKQDATVTEPPVDFYKFYPYESQDRRVLLPSKKRKLEISESLASCPEMFNMTASELSEIPDDNYLGVSQQAGPPCSMKVPRHYSHPDLPRWCHSADRPSWIRVTHNS